ncbi:MAG: alpha/beta hydrolase [Nitrososphaerales archaeon]|jgi:pimeloyl-ACP methyl ester carboxylesterase
MNYDNRALAIGPLRMGYRVEGAGGPWVVLLHGLRSHSGTWRKLFPVLSGSFRVVAPSLPAPPPGGATSELADGYAELVRAVCAEARVERACIVGNSMGGWVAMRLVSRHPGLVSGVVLEDSAGTGSEDVEAVARARVPALIVWGASDQVLSPNLGSELHSRLPGSELRVLAGAGHVPHWETPEAFDGLVAEFLRRNLGGPVSALSR